MTQLSHRWHQEAFRLQTSLTIDSHQETFGCDFLHRNIFISADKSPLMPQCSAASPISPRRPIYSLVDADLIFFFFFPPFFLFSIYMLSLPKNSLAAPRPSVILISLTQNGNTERVAASCRRRSVEDEEGCRGGWRVGTPPPVTDTWRRVSDWFPTRMTRLGVLLRPWGARG